MREIPRSTENREDPVSPSESFLREFVYGNSGLSESSKAFLAERVAVEKRGPWSEADFVRRVYESGDRIVVEFRDGEAYLYPPLGIKADADDNAVREKRSMERDLRPIATTDFQRKMTEVGFDASVVGELLKLVPSLGLRENSEALFLGPSKMPLQFLVANACGSVEVLEKNGERRDWIRGMAESLGISEKMRIREHGEAEIGAARFVEDSYDLIVALSILDLVGESPEVYRRMLRAVRDGGKIIIGHHEMLFGDREKLLLERYAADLRYSVLDLGISIDDGHEPGDPYYNRESYLLQVLKRKERNDTPSGGRPRDLVETLRLFAALESLGDARSRKE
ncbi:MAG: hypothetical protein HGA38_05155 [Candidatus Moranbacteria bacterium]|nr:hypothetical protein [Candidatus Moranbacteria bacterium]NTW45864.1 hypothetical protein [Candidatus Moranbacteria bacterium]